MNWDRIEGNWKQMTGKLKEKWGKLTDDDLTQINGNREQLEGNLLGCGRLPFAATPRREVAHPPCRPRKAPCMIGPGFAIPGLQRNCRKIADG